MTAASSAFTTEEEAIAFLRQSPVSLMDPNLITISAARGFVMGSRTSDFPVTIANGMTTDVRVRMNFTSEVPQRISVPPTEVETVPAGESLTLNVAPEATSNGVVQVIAQLETAGGQAFGEEVPIQITATEFGRVGWLIIIVSGAVVLGGTVLRIRAVRAERTEVAVESLVPVHLLDVTMEEFMDRLEEADDDWAERIDAARSAGHRLQYIGLVEGSRLSVRVREIYDSSPFAHLRGTDNMVVFTTDRYHSNPLVIQGPGAGPVVTSAGLLVDLIKAAELVA